MLCLSTEKEGRAIPSQGQKFAWGRIWPRRYCPRQALSCGKNFEVFSPNLYVESQEDSELTVCLEPLFLGGESCVKVTPPLLQVYGHLIPYSIGGPAQYSHSHILSFIPEYFLSSNLPFPLPHIHLHCVQSTPTHDVALFGFLFKKKQSVVLWWKALTAFICTGVSWLTTA